MSSNIEIENNELISSPSLNKTPSNGTLRIKPLKPKRRSANGLTDDKSFNDVLEDSKDLWETLEYSKRLNEVEHVVEDTLVRIDDVDDSISCLSIKLDSILNKLLTGSTYPGVVDDNDLSDIDCNSVHTSSNGGGDDLSEEKKDNDDKSENDDISVINHKNPSSELVSINMNKLEHYLADESMYLLIDEANLTSLKEHDEDRHKEANGNNVIIVNDSDAWKINPKNR